MDLINPVGGEWMRQRGWISGIFILACCEHHFIRLHENLVQHPSNNISIPKIKT